MATSDASARVGRELVIIDSSICVATMTGFAFSRAIWMARFCTSGTCSSGISTPRSPRATMIPSKARTIASRLSTASGFSIFAITGTRAPLESIILWTGSMSAGLRTNESATMSTRRSRANSRSPTSFSVIAGTETFMPGSERPLLSLTGPPSMTRQTTSRPSTAVTRSADLAVVDQQAVVDAGVVGQALVGGRDAVVGAGDVVDGDPHLLAGAP